MGVLKEEDVCHRDEGRKFNGVWPTKAYALAVKKKSERKMEDLMVHNLEPGATKFWLRRECVGKYDARLTLCGLLVDFVDHVYCGNPTRGPGTKKLHEQLSYLYPHGIEWVLKLNISLYIHLSTYLYDSGHFSRLVFP